MIAGDSPQNLTCCPDFSEKVSWQRKPGNQLGSCFLVLDAKPLDQTEDFLRLATK